MSTYLIVGLLAVCVLSHFLMMKKGHDHFDHHEGDDSEKKDGDKPQHSRSCCAK